MNSTREFWRALLLRSSGIFVFLLLWEAAPRLGWVDSQFLPAVSTIVTTILWLWQDGDLPIHIVVSLWRALFSLFLAASIAIPLGFLLETSFPSYSKRLDPFLRLLSHVNPFSLAPVFLLLFGMGETAKIATITLVALWPILFHTVTGLRTVEPLLLKTASSMNAPLFVLIRHVLWPAAFPTIITGLRVGAQMATFMLIGAEMLGAHAGLGWLVHNSAMLFQIPRLYAAGVFIILLGVFINQLLLKIEKDVSFWRESSLSFNRVTQEKAIKEPTVFYMPILIGVVAGILIFGGTEVQQVNQRGLTGSIQSNQGEEGSGMQHHNMQHHHMEQGAAHSDEQHPTVPTYKPAVEAK